MKKRRRFGVGNSQAEVEHSGLSYDTKGELTTAPDVIYNRSNEHNHKGNNLDRKG